VDTCAQIDKEGVDAQKVLYDLMNYGLVPEEFGGDVQVAMISARTGEGIEDLLDKIAVQAEIMDLRAPTNCPAQGVVVESRVRKGVGPVATMLVQKGMLRVGDLVLAGGSYGKVKKLLIAGSSGGPRAGTGSEIDVSECGPSTPVHVRDYICLNT
jgi:translation initiation factor IF-2